MSFRCMLLVSLVLASAIFQCRLIAVVPSAAPAQALAELIAKATAGDAAAQNELGDRYANGDGVTNDFVQAVKWYELAAAQAYPKAELNLGICYDEGDGVYNDSETAVKWYRKAAEHNEVDAQYNLGVCYEEGDGVTADLVQAATWYRRAAEQGDKDAQYSLGCCYHFGRGLPKDLLRAQEWYLQAAAQGQAEAKTAADNIRSELKAQTAKKFLILLSSSVGVILFGLAIWVYGKMRGVAKNRLRNT